MPSLSKRRAAGQLPVAWIGFEQFEQGQPDGGNPGSQGYLLLLHEIEEGAGLEVSSGQDLLASVQDSGVGQAPGVDVEHGNDGQDDVVAAEVEVGGQGEDEGVQAKGAVRVDDALGAAGGAGGVAHGGGIVFGEIGVERGVFGVG